MTIKQTYQGHLIAAAPGQTVIHSDPIDMEDSVYASFEVVWAALTTSSSIAANFVVETSNSKVNWKQKANAALAVSTTDGNDLFSLNDVCTERWMRISWDANGVTGGAINVYAVAKG